MDDYVNAKLSKWYDANEVLPLPNRIVIVKSKESYSHGFYIGNMIATEDGYCLYPYFHERGEDPLCEIEDFVKWCYFQPGEE